VRFQVYIRVGVTIYSVLRNDSAPSAINLSDFTKQHGGPRWKNG